MKTVSGSTKGQAAILSLMVALGLTNGPEKAYLKGLAAFFYRINNNKYCLKFLQSLMVQASGKWHFVVGL